MKRRRSIIFPQIREVSPQSERVNAFIRSAAFSIGGGEPASSASGPTPEWFEPGKAPKLAAVMKNLDFSRWEDDELFLGIVNTYQ